MRDSIAARRGTSTLRARLLIAHGEAIRGLPARTARECARYATKFAHVFDVATRVCCMHLKARGVTIFYVALNELPQKRQLALA